MSQLVPLIAWPIHDVSDEIRSRVKYLYNSGWQGICFVNISRFEHKTIKTFIRQNYTESYVSNIYEFDGDYAFGIANATEAQVWLPKEANTDIVWEFIKSIPTRNIEFSVNRITKSMLEILEDTNHHLIEFFVEDEQLSERVMISMIDDTAKAVQLRLMAPSF
jgi:hypothetical protein